MIWKTFVKLWRKKQLRDSRLPFWFCTESIRQEILLCLLQCLHLTHSTWGQNQIWLPGIFRPPQPCNTYADLVHYSGGRFVLHNVHHKMWTASKLPSKERWKSQSFAKTKDFMASKWSMTPNYYSNYVPESSFLSHLVLTLKINARGGSHFCRHNMDTLRNYGNFLNCFICEMRGSLFSGLFNVCEVKLCAWVHDVPSVVSEFRLSRWEL